MANEVDPQGGSSAEAGSPSQPPAEAQSAGAAASTATPRKTAEERKEALARAIHTQVAQGARVESQSDFQAILVRGHRPNHLLHFILGFVTVGLWWLVWLGLAIFGGEKRISVGVDEWGNTNVQQL